MIIILVPNPAKVVSLEELEAQMRGGGVKPQNESSKVNKSDEDMSAFRKLVNFTNLNAMHL